MEYINDTKTANQIRRQLQKAAKQNQLQFRRIYYTGYDSCHPVTETPNAQWENVSDSYVAEYLKASKYPSLIYPIDASTYMFSLFYGDLKIEFRIQVDA